MRHWRRRYFTSLRVGFNLKARDLNAGILGGEDDGAAEALQFVRETEFGDDEFFFANLMEAHSPYCPPEDYRTTDVDASPGIRATIGDGPDVDGEVIEQSYEDSVRYLSDIYEDIFAELAAEFEYVVTLGDHGESFGTHGVWSHNHGINPELTHVPLSIYRGREEHEETDTTVGLLDVYRTITSLMDVPPGDRRGQSLLDDPQSRDQLVERFGLTGSHVENLKSFGLSGEEIRRWDSTVRGIAPAEGGYGWEDRTSFEHEETSTDAAELRERIDQVVGELEERSVDISDRHDVDESVQRRLETLGYA